MSNKLKKEIKNKCVTINGCILVNGAIIPQKLNCIITNDRIGKSLSIGNDDIMFEIPFEKIEEYLK